MGKGAGPGGVVPTDVDPLNHGSVIFSPSSKLLVQGTWGGKLHVWNATTGQSLAQLSGHSGAVLGLAFAPDGKKLVSASADTTALIWDIAGLEKKAALPGKDLTAADLQALWAALAGDDAAKASDAIADLAAGAKQAVPFFKANIKAPPAADAKHVEKLIVELDDAQYKVRQNATAELTRLGGQVLPFLKKALAANPTLEAQKRMEALRDQLTTTLTSGLTGEALRRYRAIEALELIGTPEARQLLQVLSGEF
jgi:hypothetical protein